MIRTRFSRVRNTDEASHHFQDFVVPYDALGGCEISLQDTIEAPGDVLLRCLRRHDRHKNAPFSPRTYESFLAQAGAGSYFSAPRIGQQTLAIR